MTRRFTVRANAERDIRRAYSWYEQQRPGLGTVFLDRLYERLSAVRSQPLACAIVYRNVRRAVVSGFPYVVFYVADDRRTTVLAVLHQLRNPASWPRG